MIRLAGIVVTIWLIGCGEAEQRSHLFDEEPREKLPQIHLGVSTHPEVTPPGPGAGEWNSEAPQFENRVLKKALLTMLNEPLAEREWGPEAVGTFKHFLNNSGLDYTVSHRKFLSEVPSALDVLQRHTKAMESFFEAVVMGRHRIGSVDDWADVVTKEENENWFLAVNGYQVWILGELLAEERDGGISFEFSGCYHLWDRYDWDPGVVIPIRTPLGVIRVNQDRLGQLHRQGLSREFTTKGVAYVTASWDSAFEGTERGDPVLTVEEAGERCAIH